MSERLDVVMVDSGMVKSRSQARMLIKQGDVHPTIINKYDNSTGGLTKGKYKEKSRVYDTDGNSVPIRYGEVLTPLHDPAHRWIYFPNMKKEEGLFLKKIEY